MVLHVYVLMHYLKWFLFQKDTRRDEKKVFASADMKEYDFFSVNKVSSDG
jgi:hypothetical protein